MSKNPGANGEAMDIIAAMSRVRDMSIDPNSGAVTRSSGKSIIEDKKAALVEKFEKAGRPIDQTLGGGDRGSKDEAKSVIESYMSTVVGKKIVSSPAPGQPVAESRVLDVRRRPDESAYMQELVRKCRKNGR